METKVTEKDLELEYLRFFYLNVDLGPAEEDVKMFLNNQFKASGMVVPKGYDIYEQIW